MKDELAAVRLLVAQNCHDPLRSHQLNISTLPAHLFQPTHAQLARLLEEHDILRLAELHAPTIRARRARRGRQPDPGVLAELVAEAQRARVELPPDVRDDQVDGDRVGCARDDLRGGRPGASA